ncbi:MAG: DNA polymerase III subunit delta [Proteobacteria bacterium]|nr:DNA polymerase III subunit delta [Pseudomonadota bacterium]
MKISNYQIEPYIQKIAGEKIAGCLLFGPEAALINYRFNLIAKKISPDLSDPFLVANISKEKLVEDKAILADEFFSYSMLGGRKLILIRDSDIQAGIALKMVFSDQDFAKKSDNFILIQAGDLDKSSTLRKLCEENPHFAAIACYEDDERVIKKFIADELLRHNVKFNLDVTLTLYEKFGKNRQIILSELEKILAFLGEEKNLTVDLIQKLTASEAEISTDEFISNFVTQKFDLALLSSERLFREGFEAVTLVRFLSNYLQKLYQARVEIEIGGSSFDDAIKNQRLFFKAEAGFRLALKNLTKDFLIKNLSALQDLEVKIKSGSMSPRLLFTRFMQEFLL